MDQRSDSAGVLLPPVVLFAGTLALGFVLQWLKPVPLLRPAVARLLGDRRIRGQFLARQIRRNGLPPSGHQHSARSTQLGRATDGPFRFSGNPLHLATTGMYAAAALFFNAFWRPGLLISMLVVLHWGVICARSGTWRAECAPYRTTGNACADGCEEPTMPGARPTSHECDLDAQKPSSFFSPPGCQHVAPSGRTGRPASASATASTALRSFPVPAERASTPRLASVAARRAREDSVEPPLSNGILRFDVAELRKSMTTMEAGAGRQGLSAFRHSF